MSSPQPSYVMVPQLKAWDACVLRAAGELRALGGSRAKGKPDCDLDPPATHPLTGQWLTAHANTRTGFAVYDRAFLSRQVGTSHPGNSELITFHGTPSLLHLMFLWDISKPSYLCERWFLFAQCIAWGARKTGLYVMGAVAEPRLQDWAPLLGFVSHLSILHISLTLPVSRKHSIGPFVR